MGYFIKTVESSFCVPADQVDAAYAAVCALDGVDASFVWMPRGFSTKYGSLVEVMTAVGFHSTVTADTFWLGRYDGKTGDEEAFVSALAPFAHPLSYVVWQGQDGEHWLWAIRGRKLWVADGGFVFVGDRTSATGAAQRRVAPPDPRYGLQGLDMDALIARCSAVLDTVTPWLHDALVDARQAHQLFADATSAIDDAAHDTLYRDGGLGELDTRLGDLVEAMTAAIVGESTTSDDGDTRQTSTRAGRRTGTSASY